MVIFMMEREDGPTKHYRMICDLCGKRTKRCIEGFDFEEYIAKGWIKIYHERWEKIEDGEDEEDWWNCKHHCPKCASSTTIKQENIKKEMALIYLTQK